MIMIDDRIRSRRRCRTLVLTTRGIGTLVAPDSVSSPEAVDCSCSDPLVREGYDGSVDDVRAAKDPLADQWEVVELPAIFDSGEAHEEPCWPLSSGLLADLDTRSAHLYPRASGTRSISRTRRARRMRLFQREWWNEVARGTPCPQSAVCHSEL